MAECSSTSSRTRRRAASSCAAGLSPSGAPAIAPASTCWRSPAIRTWKNSSRLPAKMARNLARSSNGLRSSRASWSTRALNSSQDSSRLMNGDSGRGLGTRRGRGGTAGRADAGAPGSTAAIVPAQSSVGGFGPRVRRPCLAGEDSTSTSRPSPSVLVEVAPLAALRVEPDAHHPSGRGILERLVGAVETRLEDGPARLATREARGRPDPLAGLGSIAGPLQQDGSHHEQPECDVPDPESRHPGATDGDAEEAGDDEQDPDEEADAPDEAEARHDARDRGAAVIRPRVRHSSRPRPP